MSSYTNLTPVALLLLAACATGATSAGGGAEPDAASEGQLVTVEVTIVNDIKPLAEVTVSLVSIRGTQRRLLGSVAPGRTRTFEYEGTLFASHYRLEAEGPGRLAISSQPFRLDVGGDGKVYWELRNNRLTPP